MRILLDTHTFLWFVMDDPNLSAVAKALIEDMGNDRLLSVASPWEMAIKVSRNRLQISAPIDTFLRSQLAINSIRLLPIEIPHVAVLATLPFHHKDPFDRMLVSQALADRVPIVSVDATLDAYGVQRLW